MTVNEVLVRLGSFDITTTMVAAVFIGIVLLELFLTFRAAQRSGRLDFTQMITRDGRIVSASKVLQLIGGIVGTWIVINVTLRGTLDWDIFAIYLAYVASVEGFSKFIAARYGIRDENEEYEGGGHHGHGPGGGSQIHVDIRKPGKEDSTIADEVDEAPVPSVTAPSEPESSERAMPPPIQRRPAKKAKKTEAIIKRRIAEFE